MKDHSTYCPLCDRRFTTHMGLVVHYWRSYAHASPERKASMDAKRVKKHPPASTFKRLIP